MRSKLEEFFTGLFSLANAIIFMKTSILQLI